MTLVADRMESPRPPKTRVVDFIMHKYTTVDSCCESCLGPDARRPGAIGEALGRRQDH